MSAPTPLPRLDPSLRSNQITHSISPKISQLHQIYSQSIKFSKQQQEELNKKLKLAKPGQNTTFDDKNTIPKKLIIDTNLTGAKSTLENPTVIVNNKFDNLNGAKSVHSSNGKLKIDLSYGKDTFDNKSVSQFNGNYGGFNGDVKKEVGYCSDAILNIEGVGKSEKNVKEYLGIARRSFKTGRTKSMEFREKQLKGLLKFLENHKSEIEDALSKDLRKHRHEANMSEIDMVANDIRHTLMKLKKWIGPEKPEKRLVNILDKVYVYNDPYGVVLIIGAWNYPILLTLGPLVGALAGGNVVILKPSELAPATNKLMFETLTNYLDQECFQIYLGGISDTTELLKEKYDYIFFTGSSKVGQIVYEAAAKTLTPCTLELGGKCPLFIDDTVDMHKATKRILWGRMLNSGQTCVAPDYLLCTREVQEVFLKEAKQIIDKFWGENPSKSESLSRIISQKHFKRLYDFLKLEKIAIGGEVNHQDCIIGPTILTDVSPHSLVMEEEIFGPILPIINIKDAEEAIDFINSREKPLAIYLFSNNKSIQNMFLTKTSSGGLTINDTISHIGVENLPFGGVGHSGIGSYHGKYGFETFTQKKAVLIKNFSGVTEMALNLRYPPYSEKKTTLITSILKKRRGISMKYFPSCLIFLLGVAFSLLLEYFFDII